MFSTSVNDEKAAASGRTGGRQECTHTRAQGRAYGSTQFYEVNAVYNNDKNIIGPNIMF